MKLSKNKRANPSIPDGLVDYVRDINRKVISDYKKSLVTRELYNNQKLSEVIDQNDWSFLTFSQRRNLEEQNNKLVKEFNVYPSSKFSENFIEDYMQKNPLISYQQTHKMQLTKF